MKFTFTRAFAAAGVIAALAIATPAFAGQADRRASNAKQKAQTSQPARGSQPRGAATTRPPASHEQHPSAPSRPSMGSRPPAPQHNSTPPSGPVSRGTVQGRAIARPYSQANPPARDLRPVVTAPRRYGTAPRAVVVAPRASWGAFRPGWGAPHHIVRFYEPYYTFRPRVRLAFGISIGYPVAYPVWYDPYPAYGYSLRPGVPYGGLSFDIDPTDAAVFIDGAYVGVVEDFSAYEAPLTLAAGRHRVELRAQDCQPMVFDITIVPGQVIPYSGTLAYVR